jgi:hypothetical protein
VKMADKILFLDNVPGYPLCVFLSQWKYWGVSPEHHITHSPYTFGQL